MVWIEPYQSQPTFLCQIPLATVLVILVTVFVSVLVTFDDDAAAEDRKFKGVAPISVAISNGTKSGGYYFAMWHDCSEELKQAYLARSGGTLPQPRLRPNGRAIEQLDAATETVIGTFSSVAHVMKTIRIARLSLCEALKDNLVAAGYRWRYAARPGDAEKTDGVQQEDDVFEVQGDADACTGDAGHSDCAVECAN